MINDIFPKKLDNTYKNAPPTEDSVVCVFNDKGEILLKLDENGINFPHYDETLGDRAKRQSVCRAHGKSSLSVVQKQSVLRALQKADGAGRQ